MKTERKRICFHLSFSFSLFRDEHKWGGNRGNKRVSEAKSCTDYWNHRPGFNFIILYIISIFMHSFSGWLVFGWTFAFERLRSARNHSSIVVVQHRSNRAFVLESDDASNGELVHASLRRHDRLGVFDEVDEHHSTVRSLSFGGSKSCEGGHFFDWKTHKQTTHF